MKGTQNGRKIGDNDTDIRKESKHFKMNEFPKNLIAHRISRLQTMENSQA